MTASRISSEYQSFLVSFNGKGWISAISVAKRFGKCPVLYCVTFAHGLMKIGATTCVAKRLDTLSTHGLLKPLFSEILIENCEGHDLFEAERTALIEVSKVTEKLGNEVFKTIPIQTVKDILISAIHQSPNRVAKVLDEKFFEEVAEKSGMYSAFLYLAKERRLEESKREAIDFVLSNIPEIGEIDEHKWTEVINALHPFSLDFIVYFGMKNAALVGRGVPYEDRKLLLRQHAIDLQPTPFLRSAPEAA